MIVGYVETKALGENLEKVLKSDQITKYKTRQNIVLTDYCEFIWIGASGAPKRAWSDATTRSQPKARLTLIPAATPGTLAMVGWGME